MSSRPIRVVRGTAAAALSVFVALFAHVVLGGGALPGVLGIAVPLILALPVCVLLAGRRASLVRLGLSVVLGQVAFNALFVLGAPATGAVGSAHHGMGPVAPVVDVAAAVAPSAAMWGAHAVATVVTVALLFVAERRVELAWRVASDLTVSRSIQALAEDDKRVLAAISSARQNARAAAWALLAGEHAPDHSMRRRPGRDRFGRDADNGAFGEGAGETDVVDGVRIPPVVYVH